MCLLHYRLLSETSAGPQNVVHIPELEDAPICCNSRRLYRTCSSAWSTAGGYQRRANGTSMREGVRQRGRRWT